MSPGDKVRCIEPDPEGYLDRDDTYTITEVYPMTVILREFPDIPLLKRRFMVIRKRDSWK